MAKIKKWTPCIVSWKDAVTVHEPANSEDAFPVAIRNSIGFLIRKNTEGVTIAMEDDRAAEFGEHDCQTVTTIPSKMVITVTALDRAPAAPPRRRREPMPTTNESQS